jgi:hypothetical protein
MPGKPESERKPRVYSPWPLDSKLLQMMPDEGIIGGVHYRGRLAKHIKQELDNEVGAGLVTMGQVQARLRELRFQGFAESFAASGGRVWAKTEKGKELLKSLGMKVDEDDNQEQ